jgi:hypothetical protein
MPKASAHVAAAHHRELEEVRRPALDAGADVEQHRGAPGASESSPASAGRSTPGSMPNAPCAAITVAPVCPGAEEPRRLAARHRLGRRP